MSRLRGVACVVVLACLTAGSASAAEDALAPPESRSEASRMSARERAERARELGHRGLTALSEKRFEDAARLFEQAESWMHSPVFLLHAARAQIELGQLESARELLARVYAEPLAEDAPAAWRDAQRQAEAELAALPYELPPPTNAPAAETDPATEPRERSEARGAGAAPTPGRGVALTPAPPTAGGPPPVAPLQSTDWPEQSPYRRGAYAAFGVGAAGLLLGAIAGGMAFSRAAELKSRCVDSVCRAEDEPLATQARRFAHVATAGFAVAAAGALTGVTLWILPREQPTGLAVVLSPSQAALQGTF